MVTLVSELLLNGANAESLLIHKIVRNVAFGFDAPVSAGYQFILRDAFL
jgi:hypothetical protein